MLKRIRKTQEPKPKKERKKREPKQPSKAAVFFDRYFLLFHIPISFLLIFIIEALSHHSLESAVDFVKYHTGAYLYNAFFVYICLTAVLLVRRRLFLRTLMIGVFLILGLINCVILLKRVSPF